MASSSLEKACVALEKSLLEDYRKLILSLNSSSQCSQHPQYSFYYSEFCHKDDRVYNKKCLESKEERKFDEIAKSFFQKTEAANLVSKVANLVQESICREEADMGKIIGALVIMEIYVKNLILMPWKKEFHVILTYSGMFKVWIEPHLVGVEIMFNQFGYRSTAEGDKFVLVEELPKVNLEMTAMVFRLASLMCLIIYSAKRYLPQVPLFRLFEVAQKVPVSEEVLVSYVKERKSSLNSSQKFSYLPLSRSDYRQVEIMTTNKRDTGTQYDLIPEEAFDVRCPDMAVHRKLSPDSKSYIETAWCNSLNEEGGTLTKDIKAKDVELALRNVSTYQQHYGFSQLPGKGLSMHITPEFYSIEDEEEEDEEVKQSSLCRRTKDGNKLEKENDRKMTFSTFKKELQLMEKSRGPGIHGSELRRADDLDTGLTVSTQSMSELSLEKFIKSRSKINK